MPDLYPILVRLLRLLLHEDPSGEVRMVLADLAEGEDRGEEFFKFGRLLKEEDVVSLYR